MGKSFRNEITPGNFIFRTREFEQMEMEFFVKPGEDEEWHEYWMAAALELVHRPRHARGEHAVLRAPEGEALATTPSAPPTSSTASTSAARSSASSRASPTAPTSTSSAHSKPSGKDLSYFDQDKGERWTPYVIEPAAGVSRAMLAFLLDAYIEDEAPNAKGVHGEAHRAAPRPAARAGQGRGAAAVPQRRPVAEGQGLAADAAQSWNIEFDDAGAIGRRYRRQDEIGTPFCVTVDFDTLDDNAVTVRERDTMKQERSRSTRSRPTWRPGCSAADAPAEPPRRCLGLEEGDLHAS